MMLKNFEKFIHDHQLIPAQGVVLVAVSGGVDSMVLAHMFHAIGQPFAVAHCNFHLRGEESDGDQNLVEKVIASYGVKLHLKHFDTKEYAKMNRVSIQVAAREIRYQWFTELCKAYSYAAVAVAHHRDDQTETFFINLIRGTGLAGLHGILPKKNEVIRPLLFAGRDQIAQYASQNSVAYRDDSSNASLKYTRNKIRHAILPLFREMNDAFDDVMQHNIQRLTEEEMILEQHKKAVANQIIIHHQHETEYNIQHLKKLTPLSTWLHYFFAPYGFHMPVLRQLIAALDGQPGKQFFSNSHRLVVDREQLILTPLPHSAELVPQVAIADHINEILQPVHLLLNTFDRPHSLRWENDPCLATFDVDTLSFPLTLRKWEKGDWFIPLGMRGRKKVSDFFTDEKMSQTQKEDTWLLCCNHDIVWIVGKRIDQRFCVTSKTQKLISVQWVK